MRSLISGRAALMIVVSLGAGIGAVAAGRFGAAAPAQDPMATERRLNALERRLDSLEANLVRIEQRSLAGPRPGGSEATIDLLRREVESHERRLREIECGLLKLDERTLPPRARQERSDTGRSDPCRLNPETPLRLAAHP
jgi:hypothetical protein